MTTYSQNLQLIEPGVGDPAVKNAWGGLLNTDMALIDSAIAGVLTLGVGGNTNVILTSIAGTADQSRNQHFSFTGVLTGNISVLWPLGLGRAFSVANNTTGAFALHIGVNNGSGGFAGSNYVVTQGKTAVLVSDGANIINRATDAAALAGSSPSFAGMRVTSAGLTAGAGEGIFEGNSFYGALIAGSGTNHDVAFFGTAGFAGGIVHGTTQFDFATLPQWPASSTLLAANGYQKLPNGLIIQWGAVTTSFAGVKPVSFPVAFPGACVSISGNSFTSSGHAALIVTFDTITPSGFGAYALSSNNSLNSATITWMALGF